MMPESTQAPAGVTPQWRPQANEVGARVRMYRVGFGDFFLVTLLDDQGGSVHIIIDCGVFKGTSQTGDIGSIEAAVADMVRTTEGRVALIIMTHRHADHIAGFARFAAAFKALEVDAVWMPIWESEYEPTAIKFQKELTRCALGLRQHFASLGDAASQAQSTAQSFMENAIGDTSNTGLAATGSNALALEVLRGWKGASPEYYKAGDIPRLPQRLADLGLTCQILGPPPVADLDLMKLMDLQKGVGQYLAVEDGGTPQSCQPFGSEWEVDAGSGTDQLPIAYPAASFREWQPRDQVAGPSASASPTAQARARMEEAIQQSLPTAALTAAKQLNAFLNNQSLVALFAFKGKNLLFVGDAQAGNWEHWLFTTDVPDKQGTSDPSKAAQMVLASLDFYKVGHHGSGNATPKAAAGLMGGRRVFACMCSTEQGVYGLENPDDPSKGTEVPRIPLLEQLASEGALVRSDQIAVLADPSTKTIDAPAPALAPLPKPAEGRRFERGPVWVDCFI